MSYFPTINSYQLSSFFFMGLACLALLNAIVVSGCFDKLYKSFPELNFFIDFTIIVFLVIASIITYSVQSVVYTFLARSPTNRFICTVVMGLITEFVHPMLSTVSYSILLAYAFEKTSMILQYVFYSRDSVRAADERERFLVVKMVLFHFVTFVYRDWQVGKYVEAATMAIPVVMGFLALLEYKEASITLRNWLQGHDDDLVDQHVGGAAAIEGAVGIEN